MFEAGGFSSDPKAPLRADAKALISLDAATLAKHFQVSDDNPLVGVPGRVALHQPARQRARRAAGPVRRRGAAAGRAL